MQTRAPHLGNGHRCRAIASANLYGFKVFRVGFQAKMDASHEAIRLKGKVCLFHQFYFADYVHKAQMVDRVNFIHADTCHRFTQRPDDENEHLAAVRVSTVVLVIEELVELFAGREASSQDTGRDVLKSHGFNLLRIGAFTAIGAILIWQPAVTAIFMDLGGFGYVVPGTVKTTISLVSVIRCLIAYFTGLRAKV